MWTLFPDFNATDMDHMQKKVASQAKKVTTPASKTVSAAISKKKEESSDRSSESESEDEVSAWFQLFSICILMDSLTS